MEKIQLPKSLSLYGPLKNLFDIIIEENLWNYCKNKTCKDVYYTLLHALFSVISLLLPIIRSKMFFKRLYNDRFEFSP